MPIKRLRYKKDEKTGAFKTPCARMPGSYIGDSTCRWCEFHVSRRAVAQVVQCSVPHKKFDRPKAIKDIEEHINAGIRKDIETELKEKYRRYSKLEDEEYVQLDESVGRYPRA